MKKLLFIFALLSQIIGLAQTEYKIDSLHVFSWKSAENSWKHHTRELKEYANGGTHETYVLRLLRFSKWKEEFQKNKLYDENNKLIETILQNWDTSIENWKNASRDQYEYDEDGNEKSWTKYFYNVDYWKPSKGTLTTYNAYGIAQVVSLRNEEDSNKLINEKLYLYNYREDAKLETIVEKNWLHNITDWINNEYFKYTYDANLMVKEEHIAYSLNDKEWKTLPFIQINYTYTPTGKTKSMVTQIRNASINRLQNSEKRIYTYTNEDLTEMILQNWDKVAEKWKNKFRHLHRYNSQHHRTEWIIERWDKPSASWIGITRYVYFWSEAVAVLAVAEEKTIPTTHVFPNPVNETLTIAFSKQNNYPTQIRILNNNGQIVMQKTLNNTVFNTNLNFKNKANGLYFIQILNDETNMTYKILKI